jgi:Glycosyl hydrolases family 38 N-terminal domain
MRLSFFSGCVTLLAIGCHTLAGQQVQGSRSSSEIQTIYIIPSSHWDLGFKLPPQEQLDDIKPHLDEVIRTAKQDPQFRWVIESAWQVQAWLDRTKDPQAIQDLVNLVRNGQIELSAVWGSEHTEFMGAEQLNLIVDPMRDIEKRLGVTTDLAMMDDVPGFTLRLPQVLARSGVRYFVTGSNLFIGGGTSLHPGKMPFHWRSPDGSTVLTWETGSKNGGYTEAMGDYYLDPTAHYYSAPAEDHFYPKAWSNLPPLEIMQRGVNKLLAEYHKAGYPYDAMMVLYMHDFVPASYEEDGLLPAVRAWNAAGKQPRLVVATPKEFFDYMQHHYGDPFPTYSGDFSGLWSEVKMNSPGITGDARWVQDYLPQAEALWSLLSFRSGTQFPAGTIADAATKMLTYDEHSGAGQPGWPKVMTLAQVNQQNQEYATFARTARAETGGMMMVGVERMFAAKSDPGKAPKCVVYNPLSWQRSGVTRVHPPSPDLAQVRDAATGKVVSSQLNADGSISFAAEEIPPVGFRTYLLEHSTTPPAKEEEVSGDVLENQFYKVRLRALDGTIDSIWDKSLRRELVNAQWPKRAGQLVRWTLANYLPDQVWKPKVRHFRGPLSDELVIVRPGTWWPETSVTLDSGERTLKLNEVFDRSRMPQVPLEKGSEYYSFEFPFHFDNPARIMVDDGIGFHDLPKDYLPGARTDGATPIHTLALMDDGAARSNSISLLQREDFFDTPLLGYGESGLLDHYSNVVRVMALRKADQGDTKDAGVVTMPTVEPGYGPRYTSSFAITSAASFDPVASYRAGWSYNVPLITALLPADREPDQSTGSFFSISAPDVAILAFKPSADGNPDHFTLRLQEIAGNATKFAIHSSLTISEVAETAMTEDAILHQGLNESDMSIGAHETLTLQLTIPHNTNDMPSEAAQ